MISDAFFNRQAELRRLLQLGLGCRIGETAVCSRKIHTIDPSRPQIVTIIKNSDAGQVFYRRKTPGEILHIDVFHAVKAVDPRGIGAAAKRGVERFAQGMSALVGYEQANRRYQLVHYVDVQTGAGGGRITGSLRFGQKETLKKAHLNHVHISAKLADQDIAAAFYLVSAVEEELQRQQVELRRVDLVQHQSGTVGSREDISAYSAFTDSFLRESRTGEDPSSDQIYGYQLVAVADILENLEDLDELAKLLEAVHKTGRAPARADQPYYPQNARLHDAWVKLEGYGFLCRSKGRYQLTEEGMELNRRLLQNARDLEAELRKQGQLLARPSVSTNGSFGSLTEERAVRRSHTRRVIRHGDGDHLAINETVRSALTRSFSLGQPWSVTCADLYYEQRLQRRGVDICLLVDASASMLGKRMKAAKNLAEHLVQNSRDRIAVVSFQEDSVQLVTPFTRNRLEIRHSLEQLQPGGLTPLAAGLRKAISYVKEAGSRSGLLLLITDGIPTLGERLGDPLRDALDAAQELRQQTDFHLCCIGLQPNRGILRRVAETAGGSLHVIDELNREALLRIAEFERSKAALQLS
ncbi:MAG: vWA domain-containing protein [Bacillota bacterium]